MSTPTDSSPETPKLDFVREIVANDLAAGKNDGRVQTRFPPEPNGYLHIGHAKAICLSFGIAQEFNGRCNLRFDDTNPTKEDTEYVDAIQDDIRWLGFEWDELHYASDYFEQLYDWACDLIKQGLAYVDSQTDTEIQQNRGTAGAAGTDSPYRDRSVEENLDLFARMRAGEFPDGAHVEFDTHRPLYDWFIEKLGIFPSKQYEFARLNLTHTLMSKRKLLQLVQEGVVDGWDDPRMPTIRGLRRRGYTPEAVRNFCKEIGVTRFTGLTSMGVLENSLRADLNKRAERRMAVLDPLKVVITNYPEGQVEELECINNPEDEAAGSRIVPFSRELYIERDDFMEDPPKKFFRLGPGREVRLRWAYFLKCEDFVKDDDGNIVELHCTYDPETKGGNAPDGRKVKGTIHWVSAEHALDAEVRLYDHLLKVENPADVPDEDWQQALNENSLEVVQGCKLEPSLAEAGQDFPVQFERKGYFIRDSRHPDSLVFNRTVTLKDSWAKKTK